MKVDKSKKDKIKQGNLKDFDLLYDVLVNGGTYSNYRLTLLDRSMPQEMPLVITEDDILAAWILGKDEESELYARGGHIHQDQPWMLNPNNKGIGQLQKDLNQNSFTSGTSESDYTPTGLYSSDSGHNYTAGIPYVQQFDSLGGLGFNVAANANGASDDPYAKFIMGDTSGGFLQQMLSQKSSLREGANYIKSLELNFGVGDNAYLAQQYNQMQPIARSTMDADAVDTWKWIFDPSGIMHSWGLIDYDASEGLDYLNLIAEQVENRNRLNFNTAVTNSNKLNLWNQLSQPYMAACGGKMKNRLAGGGYINSHYDYITDPLVKVDAGGTHQENPNEGVLTSIAPDGQPNLVEEGETIINNGQEDAYVFSDRIVADEEILKSHLLPNKFASKTYADISKELDKIIEEHKNDEISKRTFDEMISRLQQALEDQKYQEKAEEVAKFIDGLSDEEKKQLEETMVEEAQAEQQAAEEQAIAEQQAQELAAQEQLMQSEQAPEQVVMEQPEEQVVPSRYDQMMSRALFADAANQGMFGLGGHLHQTTGNLITATKPVYGPEGNIIGYETPRHAQWTSENEPAQLNADNRGWYDRTYDLADTWLKNHVALYSDTGVNPFLFTPYVGNVVGTLEGIRNNDPMEVLLSAGLGPFGRIGKARKARKAAKVAEEAEAAKKTVKMTSEANPIEEVASNTVDMSGKKVAQKAKPKMSKKTKAITVGTTLLGAGIGGYNLYNGIVDWEQDKRLREQYEKYANDSLRNYFEGYNEDDSLKFEQYLYDRMRAQDSMTKLVDSARNANEQYYAMGGHLHQNGKKMRHGYPVGREPIHGTWNGFYDAIYKDKPLVTPEEVGTFGGGHSSGAGFSGRWGDVDYIKNEPIPAVTRSFDEAFAEARRNGLDTFRFNGKLYSTEVDPNYRGPGKKEIELMTPAMNVRKVYDNTGVELQDSTRVEPYFGQPIGWTERETINDKTKLKYIGSEPDWDNKKSKGGHIAQLGLPKQRRQASDNYVFPSILTYKLNNPNEFLTGTSQYDGTYIYKDDDGNYREVYYPVQDSVWLDNTNDPNRQQYSDYSQGFVTMFDKWNNLRLPNRTATDLNTIAGPKSSYDAFGNSYGSGFGVLNGKFRDSALLGYTTSNGNNIVLNGSKGVANPIFNSTEVKQLANRPLSNGNSSTNSKIIIGRWTSSGRYAPGTTYSGLNKKDKASFDEYYKNSQPVPKLDSIGLSTPEEVFDKLSPRSFENTNNTTSTVTTDNNNTNNTGNVSGTTRDYSTWLRYAPAIGSGIQYLSDLFGITNRNDYTNPNLFQRSINAIPNAGFTPIGGYRTFNPFDETYQQNALRSMNEAARRAVINNSNGNYGATLAALNALNYNTSGQFGDLALKSREYNEKERQAIDEYNLKINQINASLSMNAQEKNQAIAAQKARLTAALAEMRQQIEDTNDAAKSANMTNFYQNLGNVGKENFNMTMVRSNPAFYYTITGDGHILYKNGFDGLNERDQAFIRSVAEPQAEELRKKHLEEANKKADLTTNKQSDYGLLIGGRNPFSRYGSFGNFGNY